MLKFIQDSKTFNFIPRFNIVLFQIKVSKMLKVIFIDLVLCTYLAAIVSDQEKFLNIDQSRRKDINLAPVKWHVNKHKFTQMLVHERIDILAVKICFIYPLKLVSSESQNSKVSKLTRNLIKLVPAVQEVLVQM
jgi:hypothetical protein